MTVSICPQQNGILSALPYMGCAVFAVLSGQIADYMRETCLYPTVIVRKSFSIIGEDRKITDCVVLVSDAESWFLTLTSTISQRFSVVLLCSFCRYDRAGGVPGGSRIYRL